MALEIEYQEGQTPLEEEEKAGLRIDTITIREELDEFEQLNIQKAVEWTLKNRWPAKKIITGDFMLELHAKMYGDVWTWAGNFRKSNKNIGVPYYKVATDLRLLLDDALYWHEKETYPPEEIAIRFKHRIVAIHCFPNGNGRHSRLIADIIIANLYKFEVFSWGSSTLVKADDMRTNYISALRKADRGTINDLIKFARS
ncbi:mobile mystery protein B [Pedobacter frigidisoli]|uniref:Mobile mystery protein B n=1 Tax=Pedobacter frigidisoli TaxID=2530455 RepID=A0A4R0NYU2_9SPHI|nr:mobile mystery protein B [Pedobacter frigidisoli]TCD07619.1 mobile mystery protein B [Pedobacter frigidisoli]